MSGQFFRPSQILMGLRKIIGNDQLVLSFLALVVGGVTGGAVIAFRESILLIQELFYGTGAERFYQYAADLPWWHVLLVPTLGGLLVGLFIHYLMPGRNPQGVADVIEAMALRSGRMDVRTGIFAALASALSLGAGASVGREGPAVHLGATFSGWLAHRLHLTRALSRTLLGCGVAAAVAASFNAPIAGALFASEVVIANYSLSAFAPVVIASVTATAVSRAYFGVSPAFVLPLQEIVFFGSSQPLLASVWRRASRQFSFSG